MVRRSIRRVYHLVDEYNLRSIERDGLFSTNLLLERSGLSADECRQRQHQQRKERTTLPDGVVIRDQTPMPPRALSQCLVDGTTPEEWYALLNSMIFFWVDPKRLERQAHACGPRPQLMFEIDAEKLIDRHLERAFVTPFNVGSATRRPAPRGRASFVPLAAWVESGWAHESRELKIPLRPKSHRPAELTVRNAVPEVMNYVLRVKPIQLRRDRLSSTIPHGQAQTLRRLLARAARFRRDDRD
jgi:hypothetical protein